MLITTLAERPELAEHIAHMPNTWPEIAQHNLVQDLCYGLLTENFPAFILIATDTAGQLAAFGFSAPFALQVPGRGTLPSGGWEEALRWIVRDAKDGIATDTVVALEITLRTDLQGQGLSSLLLAALKDNAKRHGATEMVAPVRPTGKHLEPTVPMAEYVHRTRDDGLPADPWLRTHVRAGGVIDRVAPCSMVFTATPAQWRAWTGLPFDTDGWVSVPGGLSQVRCVPTDDYAVMVEPNVWVRHPLT